MPKLPGSSTPSRRLVTIYRPGDEPEHFVRPTSVQGTGPIAGFELVMSENLGVRFVPGLQFPYSFARPFT